jgi:hypothetical protein
MGNSIELLLAFHSWCRVQQLLSSMSPPLLLFFFFFFFFFPRRPQPFSVPIVGNFDHCNSLSMTDVSISPSLESAACPYEGYFAASNSHPRNPTPSPDNAGPTEGMNDSVFFEFESGITLAQQHDSRVDAQFEDNAVELEAYDDSTTAESEPGQRMTPNSFRGGSIEDRVVEASRVVESLGGGPWVDPFTELALADINPDVPDLINAISAPLYDDGESVAPQDSKPAVVLTVPLPASKKKPNTTKVQFRTLSSQLLINANPRRKSTARPQKAHQAAPQGMNHVFPHAYTQAQPQVIQHAPFQGVCKSVPPTIQLPPNVMQQLGPQAELRVHAQVAQQGLFQGVQQSPTQGTIPQTAMQPQPQFIDQPIPISVPQGLSPNLMHVNPQCNPPTTPVILQKIVHAPSLMNNPRPAKRQARGPLANYSPPATQLETARAHIAQLIADKKRMEQELDKFTVINPETGKTYVETLKSKNGMPHLEKSVLPHVNAKTQTLENHKDKKYQQLVSQYNALVAQNRLSLENASIWQQRYYELSAALWQPIEQDTEMSCD